MKQANYTVEAVFVISICIWVLLALLYGSFYIHDRVILGSVTNEWTMAQFQKAETPISEEWKENVREDLEKRLFLVRINRVQAKKHAAEIKVEVHYKLPISIKNIKALFSEGDQEDCFVTVRELPRPTEYKWDYRLLKEKEKK